MKHVLQKQRNIRREVSLIRKDQEHTMLQGGMDGW